MAKSFICTSSEPVAQTKDGKIRGFILNGTYTFHGIKYADAKRFQAPTPVKPWNGIKDALSYGYIAPLIDPPSPMGDLMIPHRFWPENEHCQYLNIWTRSIDSSAKKPVMVWLHGGGFAAGSSIEMVAYDGDNLATYGDVVVVSLNHRLNILGYLDASAFGEQYANSGNAGMADIVEALRWIRSNIEAFGGDPDNVTIFGQSGGGMKVTVLTQTPAAEGLFHKAIVMSGVTSIPMGGQRDDKAMIDAMLTELGVSDFTTLETMPFDDLTKIYHKTAKKLYKQNIMPPMWGPMPNDWYVGDPLHVDFSENAKKIPTMVGTVVAEFAFGPSLPNKHQLTVQQRRDIVAAKCGEHTDKLIDLFQKAYPGKNETDALLVDTMFRKPSLDYIEKKAAVASAPVYSYMFALEFDFDDGRPAWHCSEIPYVFHNTDKVAISNMAGVSDCLEKQLANAFIQFAKTGDPNHSLLPDWPRFTSENKATMVFDRECEVRVDYDRELLAQCAIAIPPFNFASMAPKDEA